MINIQQTEIYQSKIKVAGDPQQSGIDNLAFASLADLPTAADFELGVAQIGNVQLYSDGKCWTPLKKSVNSFLWCQFGGQFTNAATPFTSTRLLAITVPKKFHGVRIGHIHAGSDAGTNHTQNTRMLVAGSDDIGTEFDYTAATAAEFKKCIQPRYNGSANEAYNAIVNAGAGPGWRQVTWSGAASVSVTDPGVYATGKPKIKVTWSDIISCEAFESAIFAGKYHLLIRIYDEAAYTSMSGISTYDNDDNYYTDFHGYPTKFCSRILDSVTTPSNWTDSNNPAGSSGGLTPLLIEFFTDDPISSVLLSGDSRFDIPTDEPEATSKYYFGFPTIFNNQLVAANIEAMVMRNGKSSETSSRYTETALAALANDKIAPSHILHIVYSVNDGTPSASIIDNCKLNALKIIKRAAEVGSAVILIPAFPSNSNYTAYMPLINALETWCRSVCPNVISVMSLFANPTTGVYLSGYGETKDAVSGKHMSQAGYAALADVIATYIK